MRYINFLKIFLVVSLFFGSLEGKETLTQKENQQLFKLVKQHVTNIYGKNNSIVRWEKPITYATWFEKPQKGQDEIIDRHFRTMSELTGLKIEREQNNSFKKANILFAFVQDYYRTMKHDKGAQYFFMRGLSQKEVEERLKISKEKGMGGAYNLTGGFDGLNVCAQISTFLRKDEEEIVSLKFVYECLTDNIHSYNILTSVSNSNYKFKYRTLQLIDIALLKSFYSKEIKPYIGTKTANNPKNIKEAIDKFSELIVEYLLENNQGKRVLSKEVIK